MAGSACQIKLDAYCYLLGVSNDTARKFYEKQAVLENWGYRELDRQINSSLFERLALSKDKKGVLQLAETGHIAKSQLEIVKDPYVLDFLKKKLLRAIG